MMNRKTRVLLVDDHPVVRAGNRRLLEGSGEFEVVGEAADGEEAYRSYCQSRPDVVVMDLAMPGMGGLEAIRRILAWDDAARILVFSMHESGAMLTQAMKSGARGFLSKTAPSEEFPEAVRKVAADSVFVEGRLLPGALEREPQEREPGLAALSPREFEVFRLLAEGHRVPEIGEALQISPKTVGVHRARVMQKLGTRSTVQLLRLALNHGVVTV